jgi:type VI protein secretion system component Hcp
MDRADTDLVMKFVLNGQPVLAECMLEVAPPRVDPLMEGFTHSTDYRTSTFFEIADFDFGMALKEDEATDKGFGDTYRMRDGAGQAIVGAFSRWRSALRTEIRSIKYPVELDKFSFSRNIDRASPVFFEKCCTSTTFDSATLVKRISQGGEDRPSVGYLRIDFTSVLITGLSWDDGEMVKEKCEFISKKMTIKYRRQQADGSITSQGEQQVMWTNEMAV